MCEGEKQYQDVCRDEFRSLHKKMDAFFASFYKDNGSESIQSKINRHDIWIGRATRVGIAIGVVITGLSVERIQDIVKAFF